jgi:hypothetical protein
VHTKARQSCPIVPASSVRPSVLQPGKLARQARTSWTPISIRPRGATYLVYYFFQLAQYSPSTTGRTMSFSRSAARIRGQLCGRERASLTTCRSSLPNEPTRTACDPYQLVSHPIVSTRRRAHNSPSPIWLIPTGASQVGTSVHMYHRSTIIQT